MKKIFTLIAIAMMTIGANASTYYFSRDKSGLAYKYSENATLTTYTMEETEGFSLNYTSPDEMYFTTAQAYTEPGNNDIQKSVFWFGYKNSANQSNAVKSGIAKAAEGLDPEIGYVQLDKKNFILYVPVSKGDQIVLQYSAKGSTAAAVDVYGEEPCIAADADAVKTCTGKTMAESVYFKATATKGGTAKIKETSGGMRVYAVTIIKAGTAINTVNAEATSDKVIKTVNGIVKNGKTYNFAGQRIK